MNRFFVTVLFLGVGVIQISRAEEIKPKIDAYKAQVEQAIETTLGKETAELKQAFYVGTYGTDKKTCYVTLAPYRSRTYGISLNISIRYQNESDWDMTYGGKSGAALQASNDGGNSLSLVEPKDIKNTIIATQVNIDSDYTYTSNVTFVVNPSQDGNDLSSVTIHEEPKLNEGKKDDTPLKAWTKNCTGLEEVARLDKTDARKLRDKIVGRYFRTLKSREAREAEYNGCDIQSAKVLACDISLPTEYSPDTLHARIAITKNKKTKAGEFGRIIGKIDFEPGC